MGRQEWQLSSWFGLASSKISVWCCFSVQIFRNCLSKLYDCIVICISFHFQSSTREIYKGYEHKFNTDERWVTLSETHLKTIYTPIYLLAVNSFWIMEILFDAHEMSSTKTIIHYSAYNVLTSDMLCYQLLISVRYLISDMIIQRAWKWRGLWWMMWRLLSADKKGKIWYVPTRIKRSRVSKIDVSFHRRIFVADAVDVESSDILHWISSLCIARCTRQGCIYAAAAIYEMIRKFKLP